MIKVTVELLPSKGGPPEHLGTALISNDGTGSEYLGHYDVVLSEWGKPKRVWKQGRVTNFPRKRLGPWDLLFRCLQATVGERNKDA